MKSGLVALRVAAAAVLVPTPARAHDARRLPLAVIAASWKRKVRRFSSFFSSCSDTCGSPRSVTAEAHRGRVGPQSACPRCANERISPIPAVVARDRITLLALPLAVRGELVAVLTLQVHDVHRLHQARRRRGVG